MTWPIYEAEIVPTHGMNHAIGATRESVAVPGFALADDLKVYAQAERKSLAENDHLWKPIPGFGSYEVSGSGKFRKLLARGGYKELTVRVSRGWPKITTVTEAGERVSLSARALVLTLFGPPRPGPGFVAVSVGDDKFDYAIENLKWATRAETSRLACAGRSASRAPRLPPDPRAALKAEARADLDSIELAHRELFQLESELKRLDAVIAAKRQEIKAMLTGIILA